MDTTERLHFHFSLSCTGEGNGNPLQCSCLENPRDRGAWWAAIYGVAQSQTRLKQLSRSSSSNKLTQHPAISLQFPSTPQGSPSGLYIRQPYAALAHIWAASGLGTLKYPFLSTTVGSLSLSKPHSLILLPYTSSAKLTHFRFLRCD